jgi:hypothetical protein
VLQNDDALGEPNKKLKSLMNVQLYTYIHVGFCKNLLSKEGNEGGGGPYKEVALCKGSNSSRNRIKYMMYLLPLLMILVCH